MRTQLLKINQILGLPNSCCPLSLQTFRKMVVWWLPLKLKQYFGISKKINNETNISTT